MNTIKIAVTEDHEILRKSIIKLFIDDGRFSVEIEAENGKELIDCPSLKEVHVVILDIRMPVMDGIETLKYLKKHHPNIKVVMFSTESNLSLMNLLQDIGANSFVDKMNPDILIDATVEVYEKNYSYNADFVLETENV